MPKNIKIGKWLTELFKERWTFLLHSLFIAGDVFNFDTKTALHPSYSGW